MQITGSGGATYTYDAENHLTSTAGVTYTYDGDGKRVMKSSGVIYWYGQNSAPLMETDFSNNMAYVYMYLNGERLARRNWNNEIDWYENDALGSARYLGGPNVTYYSDYYPFGGERDIYEDGWNQPCPFGCNPVPSNYLFTDKERDSQSNLDNFGARFYSSQAGRFLSPDPNNAGASDSDPQSWNAYSYVRNNPVALTDPSGEMYCKKNSPAQIDMPDSGPELVCDVSDAQYAQSPSYYDSQDYTQYGCSCDPEMDREYRQQQLEALEPGAASELYKAGTGANTIAAPAFWITMGFVNTAGLGMFDSMLAVPNFGLTTGRAGLVLGKMADLKDLGSGDRTLMDRGQMPNQGSSQANVAQNGGRLRFEMGKGEPIRDASAHDPNSNTGFLRVERGILRNHGWTLQSDNYWYPPGK